jgi:hypothetical protein
VSNVDFLEEGKRKFPQKEQIHLIQLFSVGFRFPKNRESICYDKNIKQ